MPVTKTAKRALRGSRRKEIINKRIIANLEAAGRIARNKKSTKYVLAAISLADRAAKKHVIHKNKAAHIKSSLSELLSPRAKDTSKTMTKSNSSKSP